MIPTTSPNRRIVTFYSYKGGVGRTMALANVAFRLANKHALRVLVVDWDLEAPGLHEFFGFSAEEMKKARGVLDFLFEWQNALRTGATAPPDVRSWFLPVTKHPYAPRHGSLALLPSGRMDEGYNARLGRFSWRLFYKKYQGGVAIEALREQLVESADIVLIDSRTGLTDAGGICTIQLPDGVVLMSAPNEQSLLGTARVARGIQDTSAASRAERGAPTMWFSLSRVSIVEETIGAAEWIKAHESWFKRCVEEGLWEEPIHANGIASYMIPFRARWSFGERLLNENIEFISGDPLIEAFERITTLLLGWAMNISLIDLELRAVIRRSAPENAAYLRQQATEAEMRGDILQLRSSLFQLGEVLQAQQRYDDAGEVLERCAGLDLARGDKVAYGRDLKTLGVLRMAQGRHDEAQALCERALDIFRSQSGRVAEEVAVLSDLGRINTVQHRLQDAQAFYEQAISVASSSGFILPQLAVVHSELGNLHLDQGHYTEAHVNFTMAFELYRELDLRAGQMGALACLGNLNRVQGKPASAMEYYGQAIAIARELKERTWEGLFLENIAGAHAQAGHFSEAEKYLEAALTSFSAVNDSVSIARIKETLERVQQVMRLNQALPSKGHKAKTSSRRNNLKTKN